jgi:hypothetical protein
VILLDAQNPVFHRRVGSFPVEMSKACFYMRRALMELRSHNRASLRQRFLRLVTLRKTVWPPSMAPRETVLGQHMTDSAAYRYKPPTYSGDVLLLQPKDRPALVDHAPGWRTVVARRLLTQEVQGHHDELLDLEKAPTLAAVIASYLDPATRASIAERAETPDLRLEVRSLRPCTSRTLDPQENVGTP